MGPNNNYILEFIKNGILEVILDIISDPITSVGIRIFFGGLFILAGLLLLLL